MRYIRTKNGNIFEIVDYEQLDENTKENVRQPRYVGLEDYLNEKIFVKIYKNMPNPISQYQTIKMFEILKQAETIEELCDEFVVENPEKDIHEKCCDLQDVFDWVNDQEIPIGIKSFDEERDLISGKHDWNVYGAIWTPKGLIYVAKMNDQGELELL